MTDFETSERSHDRVIESLCVASSHSAKPIILQRCHHMADRALTELLAYVSENDDVSTRGSPNASVQVCRLSTSKIAGHYLGQGPQCIAIGLDWKG
jgi:hypothetical protein